MSATLLSILGGSLGGVMRLAPEVFRLFHAKSDKDHEYRMSKLQLEIDQARSKLSIDESHAKTSLTAIQGEMGAFVEAVKGQSVMTGIKWIDGLNQSVRPILTYWWMLLFTINKIMMIYISYNRDLGLEKIASLIWTPEDWGILSMIIGFWFVDRAMKYMKK